MNTLSIRTNKTQITFGWIYYAFQLLILPELIISGLYLAGIKATNFTVNFIYFSVNFIVFSLIFREFLLISFRKAKTMGLQCLRYAGLGFLAYWAMNIVVFSVILALDPNFANLNNEAVGTMAQDHFELMAIATVLLVPLAEELVFRGLIFQGLHRRSRLLAYTVSASAFGVIHLIGYFGDLDLVHGLMSFAQYLPAGIALGWVYEKTDTICTPILMHMIVNFVGIFAVR